MALAVWQEESSLVDADLKNTGVWVIAKVQLYLTNFCLLQHLLNYLGTEECITTSAACK